MSEIVEEFVKQAVTGMAGFAADMKRQGIHVGLGSTPVCVTCGEAWPCSTERAGKQDQTP